MDREVNVRPRRDEEDGLNHSNRARHLLTAAITLVCQLTPLAAQELVIRGTVRHANGAPAEGFEVRLEPQPPSYSRRLQELQPSAKASAQAILGQSDASGAFELEAPETGPWRLRVISPIGASARMALTPLLESRQLPALQFPHVVPSRIRVLDQEDRPLENALVIVQGRYEDGRQPWAADRVAARTNEEGWSEHAVMGPSAVMVAADGHVPVRTAIDAAVTTVKLSTGTNVTLDVRDLHDRPVPKVIVRIGSSLLPVALTDEKGRATIVASATEELPYQLESEDLGYAALALPPRSPDAAPPGKPIRVTLEPPVTVSGLVLDQKTGDPIGGALVWGSRRVEDATRTDTSGRYLLSTWTSSTGVDLSVAARGYSRADTSQALIEAQQIEMPTVSLWPVATLLGQVVGSSGEALSGAKVTAFELSETASEAGSRRLHVEATADDGRFQLDSLVRGSRYRVDIEHARHVPLSRELAVADNGPLEPVVLTLDRGVAAWGQIVDRDGSGIVGAEIELLPSEATNSINDRPRGRPPMATSGAQGTFRFDALAPGHHDLHASAEGYAAADVNGIQVPADVTELELGTLTLDAEATLEGRVIDEQQSGISDAKITTYPTSVTGHGVRHRVEKITTDRAGRFSIGGLRADERVSLTVEASGYRKKQLEAQPARNDLEIVLELGAVVAGQVLSQAGEPVARARVMAFPVTSDNRQIPDLAPEFSNTSADGGFELNGLAPGRWPLDAQSQDDRGDATQTVDLVAGQQLTNVELTLTLGPPVTGMVVDEDGAAHQWR